MMWDSIKTQCSVKLPSGSPINREITIPILKNKCSLNEGDELVVLKRESDAAEDETASGSVKATSKANAKGKAAQGAKRKAEEI